MYTSFNVREFVCLPDGDGGWKASMNDVVVGCRGGRYLHRPERSTGKTSANVGKFVILGRNRLDFLRSGTGPLLMLRA
jgi:hypothetical protein